MTEQSKRTPQYDIVQILIVDDYALVRQGIRAMLSRNPRLKICGEAASGREAIEKVRELKPNLVVLDISMPELNGIDAAREIRKSSPTIKIIILTLHESSQLESAARHAGADEVLTKRMAAESLMRAVDRLFDESASDTHDSIQDSVGDSVGLTE
jgi:DNA-binding NarL/FixJ family response regulator